MAQLKDTIVSGSLRATDTLYGTTIQAQAIHVPTSSEGTSYGPGENGQVLKSNGTTTYWATDDNSNTHRPIQVNGTQVLGDNTTALNIQQGSNISITENSGTVTINTTHTAATAAPGKIASASAQGSSTNYARQDHTHGIDLDTGDFDGQVKIAGTNVSVKGLDTAAYTKSTDYTSKADGNAMSDALKIVYSYGVCNTAASTQAKTVTIEGITELTEGLCIRVRFVNAQSYNGAPTLNVNDLGAKNIRISGTTNAVRYMWLANEILDLTYDGDYWRIHKGGIATTTYYGLTKLATNAASTSTSYALTPASLYNHIHYMIHNIPLYSTSDTYEIGDRVWRTYYIYKCITPITEAEAWNAEHWEIMPTLQEQIDDIKQLPSVTASDNGKILRVVNGAWAAVELPSASGVSF